MKILKSIPEEPKNPCIGCASNHIDTVSYCTPLKPCNLLIKFIAQLAEYIRWKEQVKDVDIDNQLRRLNKIYDSLPTFKCMSHCSDCCGLVPIAPIEIINIAEYIKVNKVEVRQDFNKIMDCLYKVKGRCTIYSARPLACRFFGIVNHPEMKCNKGKQPDNYIELETMQQIISEVYNLKFSEYIKEVTNVHNKRAS